MLFSGIVAKLTPFRMERYGNYLSAPARLTGGDKRLIFSGLKRNLAAWGYFWKKVKRDGESLASSSVNGQDRGT